MRWQLNLFDFRNFEKFYSFDRLPLLKRRRSEIIQPTTGLPNTNIQAFRTRRDAAPIFALVSPILEYMEIAIKLEILADAAKYDASCASSGAIRKTAAGGIGNSTASFV
jgi:hypothetical protein